MPTPERDSTALEVEALLTNDKVPEEVPLLCGVNATFNVTFPPAAMVNGKEAPSSTNWELLLAAEETVTLAPLAVMVRGWSAWVPTVTLPKVRGAGAITNWPAAVLPPVPVSGMVRPAFGKIRLLLAAPVNCGAKVTLKVKVWPGETIWGKVNPLAVNSVPVISTCVRRMYDVPELVRVIGNVAVAPTLTLPNPRDAGLGVMDSLISPTPPAPMYSVWLAGVVTKAKVPVAQPATVGRNVRLTSTLCWGARIRGKLKFATLNSGVLVVTAVMVKLVDPALVKLTPTVSVCRRVMVPNLIFLGLATSCELADCALVDTTASSRLVVTIR